MENSGVGRGRRLCAVLAVSLVALIALPAFASAAGAQKSVTSNAVPVSGAVVTKVTAKATISGSSMTVVLVPGKYPFAKQSVSLKGLVSDPSSSSLKLTLKATGARNGTGSLTVTGPNNSKEPDVAVFSSPGASPAAVTRAL